ncbi:hypothetical protein BHQ21_09620 [Mycobacterium sherrisii]|uniref:Uncharacterized protein n=1 Tax=Mycobacterium sherrisii TaxID=243061 RepID=A0A1E3SYT2_9MYCO|nr:hypothetical protein [Mycobacterium sherrisii]ODR07302.1 hypothetical protein BHQ21_09620 [Mycobacterium sherrisii]
MAGRERLTDAEYAAMADDYERNPITTDEVLGIWMDPSVLRTGQPTGGGAQGETPLLIVRLPLAVRTELQARAAAANVPESDLVVRAVLEYFDNHPAPK